MSTEKPYSRGTRKITSLPQNIKVGPSSSIDDIKPSAANKKSKSTNENNARSNIENQKTNQAIDDIVMTESNEVLEAEDARDKLQQSVKKKPKNGFSFAKIFKNKWFYIGLLIAIIVGLFIWPQTRYTILGLFIKRDYQFVVVDSSTNSPVGGAKVTVNGQLFTTNAAGSTTAKLNLGDHKYTIAKDLYMTASGKILVGLFKSKSPPIKLVATGRQITIQLTDKLTGKAVAGADVAILNTSSTTNSYGQTSLVLPTKSEAYLATITANGYNKQTTSVLLSKPLNSFTMIPAGNLFFLANGSGLINVMETNLDGSDPQDIVPGTGHESATTTSLIESPDWKYLLLEANRSGSQPELYVINAATGDLTEFDSSPDQFNLLGWNGDSFVYDEVNSGEATSTVGREQLKSYDAVNARLNILDQNQVNNGGSGYAYQTFSNLYLISNEIIYITNWATSGTYDTSTLTTTIRGVQVSGANKNDFQSFASPNTGSIGAVKNSPNSLYYSISNTSTNQTGYYQYTNGSVSQNNNLTPANFSQSYPKYFLSPSGSQTLWTQSNTYEGDQNGQNPKIISTAAGYTSYSWYDNVYILLNKSNQLYITPINGSHSPSLVGTFIPSAS